MITHNLKSFLPGSCPIFDAKLPKSSLPKELKALLNKPKYGLSMCDYVCLEEHIMSYSDLLGMTNLNRAGPSVKLKIPLPWNNVPKLLIEVIFNMIYFEC